MSNLIPFLKIVGAVTTGTAVIGGGIGAAVFYQKDNKTWTTLTPGANKTAAHPTIYVVAETLTTSNQESTNIITENKTRNYECQLGSNSSTKDTACEIESIKLPTNKKILSIDEVTQLTGTVVSNELLKTEGSYFKIKVTDSFYQSVVGSSNQNIQVALTTPTAGKKLAELKPIFSFKDSTINAKTLYSVGKVASFLKSDAPYTAKDEIKITNSSSSKCLFTKSDSDANEQIGCSVHKITTNNSDNHSDFSKLSFIGSETEQSDIKKDKYYLFKFASGSEKEATKFKTNAEEKVVVTSDEVNKLNIVELVPSILLGSTSGSKTLLLLGNATTKTSN